MSHQVGNGFCEGEERRKWYTCNSLNYVFNAWLVAKHAYRYLHFKVVPVHLDADVGYGPLKEPGRPQHQHQLEVPRKRSLCKTQVSPSITIHLLFRPCIYPSIWSSICSLKPPFTCVSVSLSIYKCIHQLILPSFHSVYHPSVRSINHIEWI